MLLDNKIFDSESLLKLTEDQFRQLMIAGEFATTYFTAKDYWIADDFSRLFLCYVDSAEGYFFRKNPPGGFENFLRNSCLINFYPKSGQIKLIYGFDKVLFELLPSLQEEIDNTPIVLKTKFTDSGLFSMELIDEQVDEFLDSEKLMGKISSDCSIHIDCSDEYLWADEGIGYLIIDAEHWTIDRVRLYQFRFE